MNKKPNGYAAGLPVYILKLEEQVRN